MVNFGESEHQCIQDKLGDDLGRVTGLPVPPGDGPQQFNAHSPGNAKRGRCAHFECNACSFSDAYHYNCSWSPTYSRHNGSHDHTRSATHTDAGAGVGAPPRGCRRFHGHR